MPGFGSLMAGRVVGYAQAVLGVSGLILTVVFGARFIFWYVANWSRLQDPEVDPMARLAEMWLVLRWAVLGMGVFFMGLVWALASSIQIVRSARKLAPTNVPPCLG